MILAVVGGVSFSMASCSAEVTTTDNTEEAAGDDAGGEEEGDHAGHDH